MKKLLVVLLVLLVVLVVADRAALATASSNLRRRAQESVRNRGEAHARIESLPFLGRLLVSGSIEDVHVRVNRVGGGPLTFASVRADLHRVTVSRSELIRNRRVRLTGLRRGTLTAELTQEEVSRAVGATVRFLANGRASISVRGVRAEAAVRVGNGTLTLRPAGLAALALPIPRAPLLPCATQSVQVLEGRVRASCTVDRLPSELARANVLQVG